MITLSKSASAKPVGSTANIDVKNGAEPRISASILLRLLTVYLPEASQEASAD